MKHGTKIEWTHFPGYRGESWNPISGCTPISVGCEHCYALRAIKRFHGRKGWPEEGQIAVFPERFTQPLRWIKPRAVFVCSMSDLFHPLIKDSQRDAIFAAMLLASKHLYLVLTKRPQVMVRYLNSVINGRRSIAYAASFDLDRGYLGALTVTNLVKDKKIGHMWFGVTVENDHPAIMNRISTLLQAPVENRYVSVEPMLSRVKLSQQLLAHGKRKIDWVVCGAESGPGARPMELDWARSLRDQCMEANVPFLMKQICENGRKIPFEEWPEDLQIRQFPESHSTVQKEAEDE